MIHSKIVYLYVYREVREREREREREAHFLLEEAYKFLIHSEVEGAWS